jgi:hypothetical protein
VPSDPTGKDVPTDMAHPWHVVLEHSSPEPWILSPLVARLRREIGALPDARGRARS